MIVLKTNRTHYKVHSKRNLRRIRLHFHRIGPYEQGPGRLSLGEARIRFCRADPAAGFLKPASFHLPGGPVEHGDVGFNVQQRGAVQHVQVFQVQEVPLDPRQADYG